jgi:hypothetical protein
MAADHIRYDILAQDALREMVRKVLAETAKTGLKGEHHFNITFATGAPGVRIPARLREQYPQEMTIVLQYQFWDLKVGADVFEVGLSFGGVPERLTVPLTAITSFVDPSVQFALQFQAIPEDAGADQPTPAAKPDAAAKPAAKPRRPARHAPAAPAAAAPAPAKPAPEPPKAEAPDKGGAEVVRLDRFRKR